MAMCKECGSVVGSSEIKNGLCTTCIEGNSAVAIAAEAPVSNSMHEILEMSDFKNPFSFRGRSGRLDYLVYGILVPLIISGTGVYAGFYLHYIPLMLVLVLVGTIIGLAALVRRCRDRGENVVLVIILMLVPYVSILVSLYLLLAPSKKVKVEQAESKMMDKKEENL